MAEAKTKLQKYSAPALEKGLDILEFLSVTDKAPSLSQLAAGIGRSKSEIFRMMIVLEERGYIRRANGDQFELTNKLGALSSERSLNNRLADIASPVLSKLSEDSGYSSHLSVLDDRQLLVIAGVVAAQSYGLSIQIGHRSEVFGTSAGGCFLTHYNTAELDTVLAALSNQAGAARAAFARTVASCAANNFIMIPNPENHSIQELSTPIRDLHSRKAVAAVTIPFMSTDQITNRLADITDHILEAARTLEERINIILPNMRASELVFD